jgi:hypothetical protein
MTVHERQRLNALPVSIHSPQRRAPVRNAEVRPNCNNYRDNARPEMQNGPAFRTGIGVRTAQTVARCPCKLRMSQLSVIEIP